MVSTSPPSGTLNASAQNAAADLSTGQDAVPAGLGSSAPVWLLDFDGVINANRPGWGVPPHRAHLYDGREYHKVRWAPPLIKTIRDLHVARRVEVRWSTTWCPVAYEVEAAVRLPRLACALSAEDVRTAASSRAAKLRVALEVVEVEQRPLIWTDDDAIPADGADRSRLEAAGVPVHLVAPPENRGLQREHLADISAFIDRLQVH